MGNIVSTKQLSGLKVIDSARGKRIGKVRHFVFHPSERRCLGFTVKRPDAALMFHRKDAFVPLGGYRIEDGLVVAREDKVSGKDAARALGLDWASCVIWVGMPVIAQTGDMLGYVAQVAFDDETGEVASLTVERGLANDAIVGKRMLPARFVKGFRRGAGEALAPMGEDVLPDETAQLGAILVSEEALEAGVEGGVAAAAGKASVVVAHAAKKAGAKVKGAADVRVEAARPAARRAAEKTGEAVEAGSFALGRQLGRASGMFSAFKEEFDKAAKGEGD